MHWPTGKPELDTRQQEIHSLLELEILDVSFPWGVKVAGIETKQTPHLGSNYKKD
jgi:hypothetical protein